ncbi:hypothetical protein PGQ11_002629 [Apiospora arundinis]|uniref:Uncharacterized protein n=1 Tax=Apiospora arundinis TaxID=335852 RepID=A0ABR2JJB2_9PEZI
MEAILWSKWNPHWKQSVADEMEYPHAFDKDSIGGRLLGESEPPTNKIVGLAVETAVISRNLGL